MALVMLPCDLPWWTSVQRHLKHLLLASSPAKLTASMLKIHDMCNIGIDPDDDIKDPELMKGLEVFLEEEMTEEERRHFLDNTIRIMVNKALHLKRWRPPKGLMFSLQQQSDVTELEYNFVSSLVAHAFFSTNPKRTLKTHPTLQDFNFTHFFKNLHRKSQRNKLKSLLHYFEWLDKSSNEGSIKLSRQKKCWLSPDGGMLNNRRGRFIVLGSSGECLPVTRSTGGLQDGQEDSLYSSCSEDEGRGESARPNSFQYLKELSTEERRLSFADRLREALRREAEHSTTTSTGDWSTDSSSYAVGISISGAGVQDNDISNGEPSPRHRPLGRKETGNSSKYSFSTEYTSELEEVYEQFNQWLNDPIVDAESGEHKNRELDSRDLAVIRFAGSLLKRTLSESLAVGGGSGADAAELYGREPRALPPRPLALAARSLSLELARHKHRLAAHLKRKVKESIPEEIIEGTRATATADTGRGDEAKSTDTTESDTGSNRGLRRKKLNWMINMIVETIEETVECEPVTVKLKKPKVRRAPGCR
ncbi:hypothetical protein HF086_001385 [Spodoptera exigua]|uniref:PARG helical domain-containing protein n=1 Tax=Spodoptera exigua TaxID=7107 RepID=A0A922MCS3_SPOEX|nr:hypothetical protein HF086_001385 [Spodoptera exigua]